MFPPVAKLSGPIVVGVVLAVFKGDAGLFDQGQLLLGLQCAFSSLVAGLWTKSFLAFFL